MSSMRATSNFFHSFGEHKREGGNSPKLLDISGIVSLIAIRERRREQHDNGATNGVRGICS
jgi:hypothetical protein